MNLFGVGVWEILFVLLLAALIFGPGRLPELAGQFGRAIRELREYARDFRDEYLTDFEEMREEYIEVRHQFEETDSEIRSDLAAAKADIQAVARDAEVATEDAMESARTGGAGTAPAAPIPPADVSTNANAADAEQKSAAEGRRRPRRPVVRQRGTEAPARPSNIISINRRRRGA